MLPLRVYALDLGEFDLHFEEDIGFAWGVKVFQFIGSVA